MNTKDITLTSKNQITIPAEFVKKLGVPSNRALKAELVNDTVVLSVQPDIESSMRKYWTKHKATKPQTDKQLDAAVRKIAAKRFR